MTTSLYNHNNFDKRKADCTGVDNISRIYEHCGIVTVCLVDPLSQLISKIMRLHENDANAIGFYYEAELHGVSKCTVILFNIYDNDPVPWLRLGYTMDLLLASPFVTKITYYPIVTGPSDSSSSLLSRATMSRASQMRVNTARNFNTDSDKQINQISRKLEEIFRTVVVETISANANAIHDKNISYTVLLLKIAGIIGEDIDRLSNGLITGYSLVNKVLLTLMGIKRTDFAKISSSIIPCPLLKNPVSIVSPRENANESDVKYIIEESRREITKLMAIFVDLFTTHDLFRNNILSIRSNNKMSSSTNSNREQLDGLFMHENELISHIVGGFQNGIISNGALNDIIKDLNNERFLLGNYQTLPVSLSPNKNVEIVNDTIMCTFQQSQTQTNIDPLRDLGVYINHIAESFDNPEVLIVNLGGMIASYNNAIKGINLPKISIPVINKVSNTNGTLSRQVIITIPSNSETEGILYVPINGSRIASDAPHGVDKNLLPIPMYNANFTSLSEPQLLDILVYIDSLRDSDGISDTRFANLQNEITHEIAHKRKTKDIVK